MDALVMQAVAEPRQREEQERIGFLFDRHHARLRLLARRLARDGEEAGDLVQETFLRAARHAGQVPEEPARAEAWLVRVLVNLCRDRSRRLRVRAARSPGETPTAVVAASAPLTSAVVRQALAALPARQRAVIVLHEIEDRPAAEIARLLGVTAVTVRWHLARARRRLRADLRGCTPERGPR